MSLPPDFIPSDMMNHVASGDMRAHVDVDARRLMDANAEAALLTWDAQKCPKEWLPVCAFNYSVTLYEDIWSEATLRTWIDGNWAFIRQIGTPPAFQTALTPSGYTLKQLVRPPQDWYVCETQTKDEYDDWIRQMPEVRITYGNRVGGPDPYFFVGDFITDAPDVTQGFIGPNDGPVLVGRYAFIRQNGVSRPLGVAHQTDTYDTSSMATKLDYSTPGQNDCALFEEDWFVDDPERSFVGADQVEPTYIRTTLDLTYIHQNTNYQLDMLTLNQRAVNPRYEIDSDVGDAGLSWFVDDAFNGQPFFVTENDAPYLIAQRIYLVDESVIALVNSFGFYVGDRFGIPLRTMEALIDLNTSAEPLDAFADVDTFVNSFFVLDTDTSDRERAIRAVEAARGTADTVLVSFAAQRPLEARDTIREATAVGDWIDNRL